MKKIYLFVFILIFSIGWTSCNNELNITAPWKDIPIIYGMLSPSDTAQYIRVERAFLSEDKQPLPIALNPDSIYYENATVQLVNLASGTAYNLMRVDANLEGYTRDTGIWAQTPNYVYKIKTDAIDLIEGTEYELVINKGEGLPITQVKTKLVGIPTFNKPAADDKVHLLGERYRISWIKAAGAELYDVNLIFHYKESLESDPNQYETKRLSWKPISAINPSPSASGIILTSFESERFFHWLKGELPVKNVNRKYIGIDIEVIAGGAEVQKYFEVNAANSGITGSELTTSYSNIPDGAGIFSAIGKAFQANLNMTAKTLDTLQAGSITKDLNFID